MARPPPAAARRQVLYRVADLVPAVGAGPAVRVAVDGVDSYDYERLVAELLAPLGPGGSRVYRSASHDVRAERPVDRPQQTAAAGSVLVVDGIFLHRDELVRHWDFSVFLDVPVAVSVARLAVRDGGPPDPGHPRNRRYVEGQRLYLAGCQPRRRDTVVIDNTDLAAPGLGEGAG